MKFSAQTKTQDKKRRSREVCKLVRGEENRKICLTMANLLGWTGYCCKRHQLQVLRSEI